MMQEQNLILKSIAQISAGHPFRGKIPEIAGSSVHAVQMKDVFIDTGINWNTCTKTKISSKTKPDWLMPGDILFAARGSHNYAVLVDQTALELQAIAAPHFYIIRCKSKNILPDYLAWLLNQELCQLYYLREAEGTYTKSIRRSKLEATPIIIPSLAKQRTIIQLAEMLKQQQQLIKQLTFNGNMLMKAITTNLLKELN